MPKLGKKVDVAALKALLRELGWPQLRLLEAGLPEGTIYGMGRRTGNLGRVYREGIRKLLASHVEPDRLDAIVPGGPDTSMDLPKRSIRSRLPPRKHLVVRVEPGLLSRLHQEARNRGLSLNAYLTRVLTAALNADGH